MGKAFADIWNLGWVREAVPFERAELPKTAIGLRWRIILALWLRKITWLLIACATLSVFLYTAQILPDRAATGALLFAALLALMHLLYMTIISGEILKRPSTLVRIGDFWFPLALALAYGTLVLPFEWASVASLVLFAILYSFWVLRDFAAAAMADSEDVRRAERGIWGVIDIVLVVIILVALFTGCKGVPLDWTAAEMAGWHLPLKDVSVLVALLSVACVQGIRKLLPQHNPYQSVYEKYMNACNEGEIVWNGAVKEAVEKALNKTCLLIDIGCADGRRLRQFLASFPDARLDWLCYDRWWSDKWPENNGRTFTKKYREVKSAVRGSHKPIVLHLSNVLYEKGPKWRRIRSLLKVLPNDSIVVVRGSDVDSLFADVSTAFSLRPWRPTLGHLWKPKNLDPLVEVANLTPLPQKSDSDENRPTHPEADDTTKGETVSDAQKIAEDASCAALVTQTINTNDRAQKAIFNLLDLIYGRIPAEYAAHRLKRLCNENRKTASNYEVIYVYVKNIESAAT